MKHLDHSLPLDIQQSHVHFIHCFSFVFVFKKYVSIEKASLPVEYFNIVDHSLFINTLLRLLQLNISSLGSNLKGRVGSDTYYLFSEYILQYFFAQDISSPLIFFVNIVKSNI